MRRGLTLTLLTFGSLIAGLAFTVVRLREHFTLHSPFGYSFCASMLFLLAALGALLTIARLRKYERLLAGRLRDHIENKSKTSTLTTSLAKCPSSAAPSTACSTRPSVRPSRAGCM